MKWINKYLHIQHTVAFEIILPTGPVIILYTFVMSSRILRLKDKCFPVMHDVFDWFIYHKRIWSEEKTLSTCKTLIFGKTIHCSNNRLGRIFFCHLWGPSHFSVHGQKTSKYTWRSLEYIKPKMSLVENDCFFFVFL